QVAGDRRDRPVALADFFCLREKVGELAAVDLALHTLAPRQQLLAPRIELALQLRYELQHRGREDPLPPLANFAVNFDSCDHDAMLSMQQARVNKTRLICMLSCSRV